MRRICRGRVEFYVKICIGDIRIKQPYEALKYFAGPLKSFAAHSASFSHLSGSNVVSIESFGPKCVICTNVHDFVSIGNLISVRWKLQFSS